MKTFLAIFVATAAMATVPHTLTSGSPAKASDVNDNFNYLDSTVQKKASQTNVDALSSAINAKADGSLKDSVTSLRAAVGGKADQSAITSLQATKVDTSALRQVRDTVRTKKDSAWIVNAIGAKTDGSWKDSVTSLRTAVGTKADPTWVTSQLATRASLQNLSDSASAIRKTTADTNWVNGKVSAAQSGSGALLAKSNLSDLTDTATARKNLGLGALATRSSITSSDVTTALTYTPVNTAALSSYLSAVSETVNSVPKFTAPGVIGNSSLQDNGTIVSTSEGLSVGGNLSLSKGAIGNNNAFAYSNYTDPNIGVQRDAKFGQFGIASTEVNCNGQLYVGGNASLAGGATIQNTTIEGNLDPNPSSNGYSPTAGDGNLIGWNRAAGNREFDFVSQQNAATDVGGFVWWLLQGTAWSRLMTLDRSGNLSVTGTITAKNGAWAVPDYVFEPSYHLPALSEVEAYTQEHKHLPEVPSASDIEKGGMDLAQMNLILLKKVEELTLHAIKQQKQIEAQADAAKEQTVLLEARLDDQKRMIEELKTAGAKQ